MAHNVKIIEDEESEIYQLCMKGSRDIIKVRGLFCEVNLIKV